jgi:hypothetical protein
MAIVALALLSAACAPAAAPPSPAPSLRGPCPVTLAHQIPPDQVIEFVRGGVMPPVTFEQVKHDMEERGNWFGSDGLWISLPYDGVVTWGSPTFASKFWAYALVPGHASAVARRLEGKTPPGFEASFSGSAGDAGPGFMASGYLFPTNGCWEATWRVGESSLTFVVDVRRT